MIVVTLAVFAVSGLLYGFTIVNNKTTDEAAALVKTSSELPKMECPLEGTPECPKLNCPLAGTPECPYDNGTLPSCCKGK